MEFYKPSDFNFKFLNKSGFDKQMFIAGQNLK